MVKIMRKSIIALLVTSLVLSSCKDEFDISKLNEQGKISLCCFPSTVADTTWIEVTYSMPVVEGNAATNDLVAKNDVQIVYTVNGESRQVNKVSEQRQNKRPSIGSARYYVTGRHQPGDHVCITASEEYHKTVKAETVIPQPCHIKAEDLREVVIYSNSYGDFLNMWQLSATFTDPAETQDYYAVRLCQMGIGQTYDHMTGAVGLDSTFVYHEISNESEPLLNLLSELDEDFGFKSNYYQNFYIFSDAAINGQTYTLHLNFTDNQYIVGHDFSRQFRAELYRITPETYRYLKSINDVDNNELAQIGFSMLVPTYSNVTDGIGIVGGFALSTTEWLSLR